MTPDAFVQLVRQSIGPVNDGQASCLSNSLDAPAFIVAGPGSGKTRVLVQRALRHVFVDRLLPEQIVITTFTKKAAKEIRSRLIDWGEALLEAVRTSAKKSNDAELLGFLETVDINRFVTGTLDSLCEDALEITRTPAEPRYTLLDPFVARTTLSRRGKLSEARSNCDELDKFLGGFTFDGKPTTTTAGAVQALKPIADRVIHDRLDEAVFDDDKDIGRHAALAVIREYDAHLEETAQLDFPRLERTVLERIRENRDIGALNDARAVLVDEYQDTNLLQEQIYFGLVKRNNAAFTVVGDDDQSLYRFRGATIELFRDFASRAGEALDCGQISPIYLKENYRSSKAIVDFFNDFIANDPDFNPAARVEPLKPVITASGDVPHFPILGIFRDSPEETAAAVADFLEAVFEGSGAIIGDTGLTLRANADGGDYGDAVLLAKSVREFGPAWGGNPPKPKLPYLLRQELNGRSVPVFNPRGRPAHDVSAVRTLLGLILECLDPYGLVQEELSIRYQAKQLFSEWRSAAQRLLDMNPIAEDGKHLSERVSEMQDLANSQTDGPRDVPILDFVYAFSPYFEEFSDDPEHQVYFEGVSRAAAQLVSFSGYSGAILRDDPHNQRSIQSAMRDFLAPLADGDIDIDEEIFSDVPRNCLNMMTIHQAKGLEFPLVLLDVSSEFSRNNHNQRFKRFPEKPSATVEMEEAFAPYTPIGSLRQERSPLQRTFEDIIREYYVAFSRPESVLVLVGNAKSLATKTTIKHIGQFWRADSSWAWTDGYPKRKPPTLADTPFERI